MIPNLTSALANRKKFIDEISETGTSMGMGTATPKKTSKFQNFKAVPKSKTGHIGLHNQGATCYLNSLLQSLYMVPEFRISIYSFHFDRDIHGDEAGCLTRQLQKLFVLMQLSVKGAISTSNLTNAFGWNAADSFNQQDVQECMAVIFDFITTQCMGSDLGLFFQRFWQGEYFDNLTCLNCKRPRGRKVEFRDLQLQVRLKTSLAQSFEAFIEKETMEGVECENCNSRTTHTKGLNIEKLPYILSLQLKRFDLCYETFQRVKVNDPLSYPQILDMTNYFEHTPECISSIIPAGTADVDVNAENKVVDENTYELLSVLVHSGSAFAGHYFCYVKDVGMTEEQAACVGATTNWLCFNDATVTPLSAEDVAANLGFAVEPFSSPSVEPSIQCASSPGEDFTGGEISSNSKSFTQHSVKLVPSATNAYMLIYRRCGDMNINSVPDSAVPADLAAWAAQDNEEYLALKKEWEYEQSFLDVHVVYRRSAASIVRIHETATVGALTDAVYAHLQALIEKKQADNAATMAPADASKKVSKNISLAAAAEEIDWSTPLPPRNCIRLRVFDALRGVLMGALGSSVASGAELVEDTVLSTIPKDILRRHMHVELRAPDQIFDSGCDEELPLEVCVFLPDAILRSGGTWEDITEVRVFSAAAPFTIPASGTVATLLAAATAAAHKSLALMAGLTIDSSHRAVVCHLTVETGAACLLRSSDSPVTQVVKSGDRLYVDFEPVQAHIQHATSVIADESSPAQSVRLMEYFTTLHNTVTITAHISSQGSHESTFATAGNNIAKPASPPMEDTTWTADITIDQRLPLSDLKARIAEEAGVETQSFRLHRYHSGGPELKDLSKSILSAGVTDGTCVQAIPGRPLLPHEFRVLLYLQCRSNSSASESQFPGGEVIPASNPAGEEGASSRLSVGSSPTGEEGVSSRLCVDFLTEFIVTRDETVAELKLRVYSDVIQQPMREGNVATGMSSPSAAANASEARTSAELPLRLRLGEKSASGSLKLGSVLRDGNTMAQSVKTLVDGIAIVAQVGPECVGLVTTEHLLLCVQEWNCVENTLLETVEITVPKTMTVAELKSLIAVKYLTLDKHQTEEEVPNGNDRVRVSSELAIDRELSNGTSPGFLSVGTAHIVLVAKPFAWQLKDASNLPTLKWSVSSQPRDLDILSGAPWRLQDGAIVLFTSGLRYESVAPKEVLDRIVQSYQPAAPEVGFRIYSAEEQQQRRLKEQEEQEERKAAFSARMEAIQRLQSGVTNVNSCMNGGSSAE